MARQSGQPDCQPAHGPGWTIASHLALTACLGTWAPQISGGVVSIKKMRTGYGYSSAEPRAKVRGIADVDLPAATYPARAVECGQKVQTSIPAAV